MPAVAKEGLPSLDLSSATHSDASSANEDENEGQVQATKKAPKAVTKPTLNLICDAIKQYNEKQGSSVQMIRKYVEAQHGQKVSNLYLKKAFEKGLKDGLFVRQDHKESASLTGRYKMAKEGKDKKPKVEEAKEPKQKKAAKEKKPEKESEEAAKPKKPAPKSKAAKTSSPENEEPNKAPKKPAKSASEPKEKDTTKKPVTKTLSGGKGKKAAASTSTSDSEAQANPAAKAKPVARRRRSKSESEAAKNHPVAVVKKPTRGEKPASKPLAGEKRNPRI